MVKEGVFFIFGFVIWFGYWEGKEVVSIDGYYDELFRGEEKIVLDGILYVDLFRGEEEVCECSLD